MDCVAPLRRGGDAIHQCPLDAVALCFLLTCATLMTSSHSEGLVMVENMTTLFKTISDRVAFVVDWRNAWDPTYLKVAGYNA